MIAVIAQLARIRIQLPRSRSWITSAGTVGAVGASVMAAAVAAAVMPRAPTGRTSYAARR